MHVIQLGINPADFEPASRLRSSPIRIGYLARIAPEKGLHLLCDAYCKLRGDKSLPETQLEVAGYLAPEHRTYLRDAKATLSSHGIGAEFHFHGTLDRKAKLQFLRGLDIFSVPVTYDDPKGLPVLEAMAAGIPVVQPRLGAFAEILETTGGGLLVQPHDANSLADGLKKLVRDGPLSSQLGSLGRKGVLNYFNVSRMVNQTLTLYQDLGIRATRPVPISL
jgi:glycosyltransferase involved in cell wall biosynthesis